MKLAWYVLLLTATSASTLAQAAPASPANPDSNGYSQAERAGPSSPSLVTELERLQTFATESAQAVAALHIDKWKTNSASKSATQANADSLRSNLTTALPGLIEAARAAPEDASAAFKVYRDVNALYEVFDAVTESTRLLGQKGQYESLLAQLRILRSVRRNLGEVLEELTAGTQLELKQLRAEVKNEHLQVALAQAEAQDARKASAMAQAELEKKPVPKKKSVAKKPAAPANGAASNSTLAHAGVQTTSSANPPKP